MNSEDYRGYVAAPVRKTQVVTLYMRQLQMQNFFNMIMVAPDGTPTPAGGFKTAYIGLGRTSPWADADDSDISDTFPPIPSETMTELEPEFEGMQKVTWKRYAKPYVAPTTAQKDDANTVYYKGLYYETTANLEYALANGFTAVMFLMVADSDTHFTTNFSFRQIGLFMDVNSNEDFIDQNDYESMSAADKGHLIAVQNIMPITRQFSQLEKFYFLIQF